jgi:predicted dehydrogenase
VTIAVGIIGCGGIAEHHAKGYLAIPDEARVVAVSDVVEGNARRVSDQAGGARMFSDYRALLAESEVDAVDICLPHHLHADAILAAVGAGKHILCEKPLCLSLDEAEAIRSAIAASGVTLMCAHNQLYLPSVRRAKELLDAGALGSIYEVRTVDAFRHAWNMPGASWRSRRETMGGGELIDTGYHPSYLLLYLAGSAPAEVVAMTSTYRLNIDGEDSAQVLVRFASGAVGNIVSSWAYDAPPGSWTFQVVGERGYLYGDKNVFQYKLLGEEPVAIPFDAINTFSAEVADFVACLRERRRPIQTEADGIAVLKVILGAYQSQAEKRVISLGE